MIRYSILDGDIRFELAGVTTTHQKTICCFMPTIHFKLDDAQELFDSEERTSKAATTATAAPTATTTKSLCSTPGRIRAGARWLLPPRGYASPSSRGARGLRRRRSTSIFAKGLLRKPKKTSRNMAYYDESHIEQLKLIKRLRTESYLPLHVIKKVLKEGKLGTSARAARSRGRAVRSGRAARSSSR